MSEQKTRNVVVAGGGFGGVRVARQLAGRPGFSVTLVTAEDSFTYYPQLYHAATGGSRSESLLPLADLFEDTNVKIVRGRAKTVNADKRMLTLESGEGLHYDDLVLALGGVTNYFGIKGLPEFSYDIKSADGAQRFKRHLHQELVQDRRPDLNYVVVGGGPTGVELAAALGEYLRRIVRLHHLDHVHYRVDLVEAAPRLLPRSSDRYARRVERRLTRLGVNVMTGETVQAETAEALQLKGQSIRTRTVIWTAGVANHPFYAANASQFDLSKNGRVSVNQYLEGRPHIYVIGDNADTVYSGMAQTAVHNADFVTRDLRRQQRGQRRRSYRPQKPWSIIPVGGHWAAAEWRRLQFYGLSGWWLRRAADLLAYRDVEAWPRAFKVWLQDLRHEDDCMICARAEQPNL